MYVKHQVVKMDDSKVQRCVICGKVIADYNNVMVSDNGKIEGWKEGEIYIKDGQPIVITTIEPKGEIIVECE